MLYFSLEFAFFSWLLIRMSSLLHFSLQKYLMLENALVWEHIIVISSPNTPVTDRASVSHSPAQNTQQQEEDLLFSDTNLKDLTCSHMSLSCGQIIIFSLSLSLNNFLRSEEVKLCGNSKQI